LAKIYPDSIRRLQGSKQITYTASELENAFSGWNQELHKLLVFVVVGGVNPAPMSLIFNIGLDVFQQFPLSQTD
jgi:hypothetical protein